MVNYNQIISRADLIKITGLSKGTIYNREKYDPNFPNKVSLGGRRVGFYLEEVNQWLESNRTTQ